MKINREIEIKLHNIANQQFKFAPIDTHKTFEKKVRTVCVWLGIKCADSIVQDICDKYYDDEDFTLKNSGYSLRLRNENGKTKYTIKRKVEKTSSFTHMERDELEKPIKQSEFEKIVQLDVGVKNIIKNVFHREIRCGLCKPVIRVKNERTVLPLTTKRSSYLLTYDTFYFEHESQYSEKLLEIEIESCRSEQKKDRQIEQLREAFEILFSYKTSMDSKLDRGIHWRRHPLEGVKTIYTLMMDIVGYSKHAADVQKQMVQTLSKLTRDVINMRRGSCDEVKHIPTGDGMIIVFEDFPELLVPIAFDIQDRLRNAKSLQGREVEVRMGLHSGPIFKYTDINGNQNFAGSGINMAQRIMSLGGSGHLLASEEAFRCMGDTYDHLKSFFNFSGEYQIKHGDKVKVYNVFEKETGHGNPQKISQ